MNDDHKNETPTAIEDAVKLSSKRILNIENLILFSSDPIREATDLRYFITTVDLVAGLYYSPLSNLDASKLKLPAGKGRGGDDDRISIIESIRSFFPFSKREALLSWDICQRLLKLKIRGRCLLLVEINKEGRVLRSHFPKPFPPAKKLRRYIDDEIKDGHCINQEVNKRMEALRTAKYKDWIKCLLFSVDEHIAKKTSARESWLMQLGFCFAASTSTPQDIEVIADPLRACCHMSAYASRVLFLERERYYRKALRQAVQGHLTKFGDLKGIKDQVKKLQALKKQFALVPEVDRFDPYIRKRHGNRRVQREKKGDAQLAWYRMTRFTMPPLLDILTSTEGLVKPEINSLVRACLAHLDTTYWKPKRWGAPIDARAYIYSALLLAWGRVRSTCANMAQHNETIKGGNPPKFKRVIKLFSPHDALRYQTLINWISIPPKSKKKITLRWYKTHPFKRPCLHPSKALEELLACVKQTTLRDVRPVVSEGLHGDAHFGNFLVDASVPEDPLVVSIDPLVVKISASAFKAVATGSHIFDLNEECERFATDPLYDVAKLLVSTACAYGIVLRGALTVGTKSQFVLKYNENAQPRQLSDTAGISGDQLVAVAAKVPRVAWEYHSNATRSVFDQWEESLERFPGGDRYSIAISHIRLWLLTVRHGFSLADHLFPQEIEKSLSMFLLVTLFLNEGLKPVSRLLSKDFEDEDSVIQLGKLFQRGVASLDHLPKADTSS